VDLVAVLVAQLKALLLLQLEAHTLELVEALAVMAVAVAVVVLEAMQEQAAQDQISMVMELLDQAVRVVAVRLEQSHQVKQLVLVVVWDCLVKELADLVGQQLLAILVVKVVLVEQLVLLDRNSMVVLVALMAVVAALLGMVLAVEIPQGQVLMAQ
jgi:hypothetical protein